MRRTKQPLLAAVFLLAGYTFSYGQAYQSLVKNYLQTHQLQQFQKAELIDLALDNVDPSSSMKADVVKFQQVFNGLPIAFTDGTALVKDGQITYLNESFVKQFSRASSNKPAITAEDALTKIANRLGISEVSNYKILKYDETSEMHNVAKQRLLYHNDHGDLKLAYEISLEEPKSSNYWLMHVDANTGEILMQENLTLSCNFHQDAYAPLVALPAFIGPQNTKASQKVVAAPDNASYNIFALPIEAPTFGNRSVVSNPWMLSSSPDGWHFDGTNHYTITRGNNVFAYEDTAAANTPGFSPDGGVSRNFDFPFDIHGTPAANRSAAITNLFYMNNMLHDVLYKFGFTETARNFQMFNYGKGGLQGDYVKAEAQDGAGTNNANFSSPADGTSGRMQMFLWSTVNKLFFYNAPAAAVPRIVDTNTASFGPALTATGVTGDIKVASTLDACTALPAGSLTGKIGLVQRGDCNFVVKVKNAQNAGAVAVVVYNAPTSPAPGTMGGTDATITIPSVLITNAEGQYINDLVTGGTTVNITLKNDPATAITPDGDFDNGIIAHEYGHGLSNRLTGTGSGCLNYQYDVEQMGEGWSDFVALLLTNKPTMTAAIPRGIGTYAVGESPDGVGIRPTPYSPDFSINGTTYGDTNGQGTSTSPLVHNIGYIWASMLWDLHWNYVEKYGFSSDIAANPDSGSGRVFQMVVNGMKLQPCLPTFVDGRNAILAADQAATGGDDKCMIWKTFAKRGLGVNASAGSKTNINDQVQDFNIPAECATMGTTEVKSVKDFMVYPNPARTEFSISLTDKILGKVNVEVYDLSGKLVTSFQKVSLDGKQTFSTANLQDGMYMVKVSGMGITKTTKLIVRK